MACGSSLNTAKRWRGVMRRWPLASANAYRRRLHVIPQARSVWVYGSLVKQGRFREWSDVDLAFETLHAPTSLRLAAGIATRCVDEFEGWCCEFVATVRSRDRNVLDA